MMEQSGLDELTGPDCCYGLFSCVLPPDSLPPPGGSAGDSLGWGAGVLWLGFGSGSGVLPPLGSVGVVCSGVCCCSVEGDGEFDGDELLSLGVGVGCVCCRLL